jgi:hypothetical protein
MTTAKQDNEFIGAVIPCTLLETAIDWIRSNMYPDEVYEKFELEEWAKDNGFVEDEG